MGPLMIRLMNTMLMKLMTEAFVAKLVVHALREIAKNTDNNLDDKIVDAVADSLAVNG